MKKVILFLSILFTTNIMVTHATFTPEYIKKDGIITYFMTEVPEVDLESFQSRLSYAKDKNRAYYMGKVMNNVDPKTLDLETLEFFSSEEISVSFGTIMVNNSYAKDKNNVYYKGEIIINADAKTFEKINVRLENKGEYSLNGVYAKDKNRIYSVLKNTITGEIIKEETSDYIVYGDGECLIKKDEFYVAKTKSECKENIKINIIK